MRRPSVLALSTVSSIALALGAASPASAQVVGPPEVVVPPVTGADAAEEKNDPAVRDADGSEAEGQAVLVTGTRIRLRNLESLEPTVTLDARALRERNFTNVADALNELPGNRSSVTPAGGQGFGQGTNFVNNFGIGSNRTLTLVNGRRFVSSNVATIFTNAGAGTQVDLNIIPAILVDRIDTVSVGGAPVYGSDAIAGTINIILRNKYEGIEASATSGISEEGDNRNYNVSGIIGGNLFDNRLNLTFAISHDNLRGLVANDRDFLRRNVGNATNPTAAQAAGFRNPGVGLDGRLNPANGFNNNATDQNSPNVLVRGVNIPFLTRGGLITGTNLAGAGTNPLNPAVPFGVATTTGLQFDTNGNLIPFNQGVVFPGTSGSGGEGFRFSDFTQITSDLKRTTATGFLTFKVTDNIDLFAEGTHFRSRADELIQQPTFNSSLFGGSSGATTFGVNNPFLTDQARAALVSRGVTSFSVSRASDDLTDGTGYNETRINYGVAGMRGDFETLGRTLNVEAYASYGKARSLDFGEALNAQKFANAVNVTTNAAGQVVCTTAQTRPGGFAAPGFTPIADPNCVPLNILGENRASQAALDYVVQDTVVVSEQEQFVVNANIATTLFSLFGNDVGLSLGYEHREEKASFQPDPFTVAGLGRSVPIGGLKGKYNLDEGFGELVVPIVSPTNNLSFLQSATLFGRGRYTDNSIVGSNFAYTVGGTVAPVRDIEFRGNYTQSFRSPAITELFLPVVNAFNTVNDLCQANSRGLGPAPATRARNCAAFIAAFPGTNFDVPDPASTATVASQSGGNIGLGNEKATSYTFGAIIRPRFIPRLAISVDYINIRLKDPIANLTSAQVVSGCFDNENFDTANVLNANAFCSRIARNPTTGRVSNDPLVPGIRTGFVNGNLIRFSGIQGTLGYSMPLSGIGLPGDFSASADMLYVRKRVNDITGVAPVRIDGELNDPEFAGQLRLRYVTKSYGINTTFNYTGEQLFSRLNRVQGLPSQGQDAREIEQLKDFVIVNAGVYFDATDDFRLTLSVNNLFNRQGQKYFGELIPASFLNSGGDQIGRRFAASARVRF
jgi:outer membrane receptor protein involved in Fe transport